MTKWQIVMLILLITIGLEARVLIVTQTGMSPYPTIQSAINMSIAGDTVLVYPGTYYENIDFNGFSITLGSLYLITQQDSVRYQTILDGSQRASVVKIDGGETVRVVGFTIRNGIGSSTVGAYGFGGGIAIGNSSVRIEKCIIRDNYASEGAGVFIENSSVSLLGNSIHSNHSVMIGGGLTFHGLPQQVMFDSIQLNSIYNNVAASEMDLYWVYSSALADSASIAEVIQLDTLSVVTNTIDFVRVPLQTQINALHSFFTLVPADLYVNPITGDDHNSGLSWSAALKTVTRAVQLVEPDSVQTRTIHMAAGTYGVSFNGEKYPIHIKENLCFQGAGKDLTIWDADGRYNFFWQTATTDRRKRIALRGFSMQNLTRRQGPVAAGLNCISNVELAGMRFSNIHTDCPTIVLECDGDTLELLDTIIENNNGGLFVLLRNFKQITFKNMLYQNNKPYAGSQNATGGGIQISSVDNEVTANLQIENSLFAENSATPDGLFGPMVSSLELANVKGRIVNSSFVYSHAQQCSNIRASISSLEFYNCLFYDFSPYEMQLYSSNVKFTNCNLRYGMNGLALYYDSIVDYDNSNVDAFPMLYLTEQNRFMPMVGSPCIDAGTALIPDYVFPLYDLAGRNRVIGAGIDIGCYEHDPSVAVEDEVVPEISLSVYPNPSKSGVHFSGLGKGGKMEISIYNLKGQLVYTEANQLKADGPYQLYWDGKNTHRQNVSAGIYVYRLQSGDKVITGKLVRIE